MGWPTGLVMMLWTLLNANAQVARSGRYYFWGALNLVCIVVTLIEARREIKPNGMHWVLAGIAAAVLLGPSVVGWYFTGRFTSIW